MFNVGQSRRVYEHSKCGLPVKGHKRGADGKLICNVAVRQPSPGENHPDKHSFIRSPSEESCLASPPPSPPRSPPPPPYRPHANVSRHGGLSGTLGSDNERLTVAAHLTGVLGGQTYAPRSPSPDTQSFRRSPSYDLPPIGIWDKRRRKIWGAPPTPEEMSRDPSLVPTLLVDSAGGTIREGSRAKVALATWERIRATQEQAAQSEQDANPQSPIIRVLRSVESNPLVTAVPTRAEDVPRLQETATHLNLHTSVLRAPPSPSELKDNLGNDGETAEGGSWIVVIAQTMELAQQYVELAQRTMPGTIASDRDLMEGPRMITTFQLVLVSLLSTLFAAAILFLFI